MMATKEPKDVRLTAEAAPEQPPRAEIGMELMCEPFETGGPMLATVIGRDNNHVRLKLENGNEWVVRAGRIDLAKRTWQHVAADYPARAADPAFDAQFRRTTAEKEAAEDPSRVERLAAKAKDLAELLPPELRGGLDRILRTATGKSGGPVPEGSVYARWDHPGKLDAPFVKAGSRELVRGAAKGDEGFFDRATFEKYNRRGKQQGVQYITAL